ncbi:MAG: uroporphyrinogen decarboxylase family protein [Sphaerochaeta sp.]|nr:uroporphyrinogen decarboxylase family protein [Sphaerochaeta sp.]
MKSRERIKNIIALEAGEERPGFWMGNPNDTSVDGLCNYFNKASLQEVRAHLGDELFWIPADSSFCNPKGWTVFAGWAGVFSDIEAVEELDALSWPSAGNADFTPILEELTNAGDTYRLSGMWSQFFHDISDMMGMENYFIAMYEKPEVVHALTRRIVDIYKAANTRLFGLAKGEIDAFFFGNDLGTQISTLVSPSMFKEFILPYMKELVDIAASHNLSVVLHSCGAITSFIPDFIALGVDAIHPVQIKAEGMDVDSLRPYRSSIAFIGGIDTQELLRSGTKEEIEAEVDRVYQSLGPNIVISPSHESILPDVPPRNIEIVSKSVYAMGGQ